MRIPIIMCHGTAACGSGPDVPNCLTAEHFEHNRPKRYLFLTSLSARLGLPLCRLELLVLLRMLLVSSQVVPERSSVSRRTYCPPKSRALVAGPSLKKPPRRR